MTLFAATSRSMHLYLGLLMCTSVVSGLQPLNSDRRAFLAAIAGGSSLWSPFEALANDASTLTTTRTTTTAETNNAVNDGNKDEKSPFQIYKVIPDASAALNPSVQTVQADSFLQGISPTQGGALWLGEHHNSQKDHSAQATLLRQLHEQRKKAGSKVAVGLEQVQVEFQPVLDEFIAGKITSDQMRFLVQWDRRWVWPFENYQEIFDTAQELGIPLVALNVNSEDLVQVERGGLPALPRNTLLSYITDPQGFAQFSNSNQFRTYVDYVIRPSYDLHLELGLLKNTMSGEKLDQQMSFRNFYSSRLLWDETMAGRAFAWTKANPNGLLVGLVGADHVKFRNGIPGRFERMAKSSNMADAASISVMLNPTLIDTRPSNQLGMMRSAANNPDAYTLQLRYLKDGVEDEALYTLPSSTGGVMPLADYLLFG